MLGESSEPLSIIHWSEVFESACCVLFVPRMEPSRIWARILYLSIESEEGVLGDWQFAFYYFFEEHGFFR